MKKVRLFVSFLVLAVLATTSIFAQTPDSLFIVGSASPMGWDIANAIELTKNPNNSDQYFYDGPLFPGEFKFPVNRQTDWGQDMYMKDTANEGSFYLHIGGEDDDLKWVIADGEESLYHIVLDFSTMTIEINKIVTPPAPDSLFIFGSATPVGWDIANAIELNKNPVNPKQYIYEGTLSPGEFKFPVNRQPDFGQDMYMKDTVMEGSFYLHIGGEADDNKWVIAEEEGGTYSVVLDFNTWTIKIKKVIETVAPDSLFIVGSATPIGWDIANAIQLTKNPDNPNIFVYHGILIPGEFKFPVNRQPDWGQDMFMKDTAEGHFYHHIGGEADDVKWVIAEGDSALYHIVLDFIPMTIDIKNLDETPDSLFIIGSATAVGWNIGQAIELTKNPDNPDQFIFDGILIPGEFKFPVNRQADWGQDMFMKDTVNEGYFYHHIGGELDDLKWVIAEGDSAIYHIVLDFTTKTIEINIVEGIPDVLYIVGSATPIGWSIDQAIELTKNPDNVYQFIYDGTLVPGEFKFPVNRQIDWQQDMYMKDTVNEGSFYLHIGGESDDNKWVIAEGEGGTYHVVLDFSNNTIEYTLVTSIVAVHSGYSKITVYPNPASDWLHINLGEKDVGSVSIYSLSGKTLYQAQVNSSSTDIDLTELNISGLVLIKVSTTSDTEVFKCMVK